MCVMVDTTTWKVIRKEDLAHKEPVENAQCFSYQHSTDVHVLYQSALWMKFSTSKVYVIPAQQGQFQKVTEHVDVLYILDVN